MWDAPPAGGNVASHGARATGSARAGPTEQDIREAYALPPKKLLGVAIDPRELASVVASLGGVEQVTYGRGWPSVRAALGLQHSTSGSFALRRCWNTYFPAHAQAGRLSPTGSRRASPTGAISSPPAFPPGSTSPVVSPIVPVEVSSMAASSSTASSFSSFSSFPSSSPSFFSASSSAPSASLEVREGEAFRTLVRQVIGHTRGGNNNGENEPFSVPATADALGASRSRVYAVAQTLEGMHMLRAVSTTQYQWIHHGASKSTQSAVAARREQQRLVDKVSSLSETLVALDERIQAAKASMLRFVEAGRNVTHAYVTYADLKRVAGPNRVAFAVHAPPGATCTVLHPDDLLPPPTLPEPARKKRARDESTSVPSPGLKRHKRNHSHSSSSSSSSGSRNHASVPAGAMDSGMAPRRYQLYLTSRDQPLDLHLLRNACDIGQDTFSSSSATAATSPSPKTDGCMRISTTSLAQDQYAVFQLPEWKKLELL